MIDLVEATEYYEMWKVVPEDHPEKQKLLKDLNDGGWDIQNGQLVKQSSTASQLDSNSTKDASSKKKLNPLWIVVGVTIGVLALVGIVYYIKKKGS